MKKTNPLPQFFVRPHQKLLQSKPDLLEAWLTLPLLPNLPQCNVGTIAYFVQLSPDKKNLTDTVEGGRGF